MKFVSIFVLFFLTKHIEALTADCRYSLHYHYAAGVSPNWQMYYGCGLEIQNGNFFENPTKIQGQHSSEYTDSDVEYIYIRNSNKFKSFSSIYCQKFNNLKAISTANVKFESIDEDSLKSCRHLLSLSLYGSASRTLPGNLLTGNQKLLHFDARQNNFEVLPSNLFQNQQNLKNLDLSENLLRNLPAGFLIPLISLEVLDLDNNRFQEINPEWFAGLQSLKFLDLDYNLISVVPPRAFVTLRGLENLYLNNNRIRSMSPNSFDGLHNLEEFGFHTNQISELPVSVFVALRNLKTLILKNNQLTTIHSDSFSYHSQLTTVSLKNNKINAIDEKFIEKTGITDLDMENNICSKSWFGNKTNEKISIGLRKCFANYRPRNGVLVTQPIIKIVVQSSAVTCGRLIGGSGNIIGGRKIERGLHPWVSALVFSSNGSFFCGGNLISNQKVVTAAHCMHGKHDEEYERKHADQIYALLGVYNLDRNVEAGRTANVIQKINIHPDWSTQTEAFDADIAVLVLEKTVIFTELIQPICLVIPGTKISNISDGIVVGYGKSEDESKIYENKPKIIETPIHTHSRCFGTYELLQRLSSGRTFCGGTGDGVGVCKGDSGSGLYVKDGPIHYLRGIVSASLLNSHLGCDVNTYSIFTDVTKYVDWINELSTSRFD